MAKLVIGWELGNGMGHIMPLRMIAESLLKRSHHITFIVRDVSSAEKALRGLPVKWMQAPQVRYQPWEMTRTDCYSQFLGNIGFRDIDKLHASTQGWISLLRLLKPDAALLEFAPSAMLACHIENIPTVLQGNGFFCPPADNPDQFGIMQKKLPDEMRAAEDAALLDSVNAVIAIYQGKPFSHISELYAGASATLLTTFQPLDHFERKDSTDFYGVWVPTQSAHASWPKGDGKRIFAYLTARPGVDNVLRMLAASNLPTLIYCNGLSEKYRIPFVSERCHFIDSLVDIRELAKQADFGIFHGNHSTSALFLLHGVPSLQIPLYMEQLMFAQRIKAIGAGEIATLDQPQRIAAALNALLTTSDYKTQADKFAKDNKHFDQEKQICRAADRVEAVLKNVER